MANNVIDEQCALLLGWHKGVSDRAIGGIDASGEWGLYWYDGEGVRQAACITDAFANMYAFSPSHRDEDARRLENAIDRNGLWERYILALALLCGVDRTFASAWALMRATPEQRTNAFIESMG